MRQTWPHTSGGPASRSDTRRPDGIAFTNYTLRGILLYAFDVRDFRLAGGPTWMDRDRFDVAAKSDHAMSDADKRTAVRAALVERFHLRAHMETRQERVYELRFERSDHRLGPNLRQRDDCSQVPPPGALPCGTGFNAFTAGVVRFGGITIERLGTFVFSNDLNQLVLDRTGLPGMYDVDLQWKASRPEDTGNDPAAELRPEFFTAVREQLGLKLEPRWAWSSSITPNHRVRIERRRRPLCHLRTLRVVRAQPASVVVIGGPFGH